MSVTRVVSGSLVFAGALALLGCADPVPYSAALVTGEKGITSIATDDFYLYWTKADGSVRRVSLDGGPPATIVEGRQLPGSIAVDETHVYWASSDGAIERALKEGGDVESIVEAGHASKLVIDASHVYFIADGGTVQKKAKAGGALTTLATGQTVSSELSLNGVSLIWANAEGGSVNDLATENGTPRAIVVEQPKPQRVAVSGSNVYWSNFGNSTVGVAQRDGSGVQEIVSAEAPDTVIGDETHVYFSDVKGGVNMASVHGGEAERLGQGPVGKVSLAIDATSIYWANSADGAIIVRPKL